MFARGDFTAPAAFRGVDGFAYVSGYLSRPAADTLQHVLHHEVPWQRESLTLFGRRRAVPRLTAWCGDMGVAYRYSGADHVANGWFDCLARVRERLARDLGVRFNFALLNRYRAGGDSMGWHSDDERNLGPAPLIASLSLGAPRRFLIRLRGGGESRALALEHASLLVMWGDAQRQWQHCLPRTARPSSERINVTWRCVIGDRARAG